MHVVYDAVGKDTFIESLDSLAAAGDDGFVRERLGAGAAAQPAGAVEAGLAVFDAAYAVPLHCQARRPGGHGEGALRRREEQEAVKVRVDQTYALKDAAQAHRDLEARKTTGSTVLLP